ncbi:MAG: hypothetical protein RR458_06305 [Clostridia bacterium]
MNKYLNGLAVGLIVGMLAISYSDDASRLVEKGKDLVMDKIDDMKHHSKKR